MRLTKWEQAFWDAWQEHGLKGNDLEPHASVPLGVDYDPVWREFDFVSDICQLLIEIDGLGGFDPVKKMERCGAHQTAKGMREDSWKRNAAIEAGWRVLHYPSSALDSGPRLRAAIEQVNRVMSGSKEQ
jgi:hypothetical protein